MAKTNEYSKQVIAGHFAGILRELQENCIDLVDEEIENNTPMRLSKMYITELLTGYKQSPKNILEKRFQSKSNDMVIVQNIPFVSLCSHHWLPFMGKAHIGYIPQKKVVVGLSKIPRLVKCFARRFQMQENMTTEIADSLYSILKPQGCIVVTNAQHLCAQIRGVQSEGTTMTCSAVRGCFEDKTVRSEFLDLIKNGA